MIRIKIQRNNDNLTEHGKKRKKMLTNIGYTGVFKKPRDSPPFMVRNVQPVVTPEVEKYREGCSKKLISHVNFATKVFRYLCNTFNVKPF